MDKWRFWRPCFYVYECVCVCACMYLYVRVFICVIVCDLYMYVCMHVCMCFYMYACMYMCMYVYYDVVKPCYSVTLLHNTVILLWESIAHTSFTCFTNTLYHQPLWLPCCVLSLLKYFPLNGSCVVVTQIWPSPLQVHQTLWIALYSRLTPSTLRSEWGTQIMWHQHVLGEFTQQHTLKAHPWDCRFHVSLFWQPCSITVHVSYVPYPLSSWCSQGLVGFVSCLLYSAQSIGTWTCLSKVCISSVWTHPVMGYCNPWHFSL